MMPLGYRALSPGAANVPDKATVDVNDGRSAQALSAIGCLDSLVTP